MRRRPITKAPDAALARARYSRSARSYDRWTRFADRYRRRAVECLDLRAGDRVLDVACGTGANFALLHAGVGATGEIVGVDLSPEMLAIAAEHARTAGLRNVRLIEAAVEDAELPGPVDAALFSLTHDVLQSRRALENVAAALRPGARVASFGSKWAPRWRLPVNAYVWFVARRYVTTFAGFNRPWSELELLVPSLRVDEVGLGGAYIACGETRLSYGDPT